MKLLTLNIWGGHIREPLLNFFSRHKDVDLFCLQEVYHNAIRKVSCESRENTLDIFSQLDELLPGHHGYFRPVLEGYGIAIFAKKELEILNEGDICIHANPHYPGLGPTHSRNLQWLEFRHDHKKYLIFNVHGLWNGQGKSDSPERLLQSHKIKSVIDSMSGAKILCGDFNLRPDTKSIEIIEEGMYNWIKAHQVQSTRTSLYPKEEKFADYIFTCPSIAVSRFKVLPDEVSDHAPILLDFH